MRIRALAVAPLLLAVLAGCAPGGAPAPLAHYQAPSNGENRKPGPQVLSDAAEALLHAGSATVEGRLTVAGAEQDVTLNLQGEDLSGTVVTRGQAVQIVVWHDRTYAKGPAAFWTDSGLSAAAAARLAGRWVSGADTAVQRLTPVSLTWLADEVREPSAASIGPDVHLARADSGRLAGTPVVVVPLSDGSTIQVAAAGPPYPLLVENPAGDAGELTLSAFEESATVVPPASAVDLTAAV
jgi:hypothetical protein